MQSDYFIRLGKKLVPDKAHGHDEIYVKMLKLCAPSICTPLTLLFDNCLASGEFPNVWKKVLFQDVVPVHKKGDKKLATGVFIANLRKINGKTYVQLNFQFYW